MFDGYKFTCLVLRSCCVWFEKVNLELEETNTFILPELGLFKTFRGICNIVIEVSILRVSKFISCRSLIREGDWL